MPLTHGDQQLRDTARAAFWTGFASWPSIFDGLYYVQPSNSDQETYAWFGYAPKMRELVGTKNAVPLPAFDYTIKNKIWESTVSIDYMTYKFNRNGAIVAAVQNLGAKARQHVDYLLAQLINNNGNAYDGVTFYGDAHIDPGARYTTGQDNNLTTNITADAPTDVEFAAMVRTMRQAFWTFVDNEGDPVIPAPDATMVLHVPANYQGVAERIASVDFYQGASGTVGNDMKGKYRPMVNPWIPLATSSHGYTYMHDPTGPHKPFIVQMAEDITIKDDLGGDNNFMTKDVHFSAEGIFNVGYGDWRKSVKHDAT